VRGRFILVVGALAWLASCSCGVSQAAGQQLAPAGPFTAAKGDPNPPYALGQTWFSRDKAYHFGISAAGAAGFYWAGRKLGLSRGWAVLGSAALMGGIGVLREIGNRDRDNLLTRDHISRKDLVWDAAGVAVGISVADLLMRPQGPERPRRE
jgi:uncharacterized protein YfiM (DUF2279 family)